MSKKFYTSLLFIFILPTFLAAQTGTIKGKVTEAETGDPLPGANVSIVGTPMGAAADIDGEFTISNVPPGTYDIRVSFIGYTDFTAPARVVAGETAVVNASLEPEPIRMPAIITEVSRAEYGRTPAAFTTITKDAISQNYTTEDIPSLIQQVPGVFSVAAGLGEAEVYIRGFNTEHVRVEINGIITNDPESQRVFFSNWTGLASNANLIQVQRGAGSWLYGSGFGGSFNVNTMGPPDQRGLIFRSSVGYFSTDGVKSGPNEGKIADGRGGFDSYNPVQYMTGIRYNSGLLAGDKFSYSLMAERKSGDYYVDGTNYDGYSFGFEGQAKLGQRHILQLSFIGAPQDHRQTAAVQDMALINTLGREYNRRNHPFQENHYFKPQVSLRHYWQISENQAIVTNAFVTTGRGGGQYLRNDSFDPTTGEVGFKSVSDGTDNKRFGRNAQYIFEVTNGAVVLDGYDPVNDTFDNGSGPVSVSRATPLISGSFNHSWKNDSQNFHEQFGLNTAYVHEVSPQVTITVGSDTRYWNADHFAETEDFRKSDGTGGVTTLTEVERRYDYTTKTLNLSGFGRLQVNPIPELTVQAAGQYARSRSRVYENPIQIYDFNTERFLDATFKTTEDLHNPDGTPVFTRDDYDRTYSFFNPKIGANYNMNNWNLFATFSVDHKEPRVRDWYNRASGPGVGQAGDETLEAEKLTNMEVGIGYRSDILSLNANGYTMLYEDKIESVRDIGDNSTTINAGKARHKGIELSGNVRYQNFEAFSSLTLSRNRWLEMNVNQIFRSPAAEIVGKVVPFSPERMFHGSVAYNFMEKRLRLGLGVRWWDRYFGSFTNTFNLIDGTEVAAELPAYFELNANASYRLKFGTRQLMIRLNVNNLTSHEHFAKASWDRDFNRTDALRGDFYMYVVQAPLINYFLTTELSL